MQKANALKVLSVLAIPKLNYKTLFYSNIKSNRNADNFKKILFSCPSQVQKTWEPYMHCTS